MPESVETILGRLDERTKGLVLGITELKADLKLHCVEELTQWEKLTVVSTRLNGHLEEHKRHLKRTATIGTGVGGVVAAIVTAIMKIVWG